MFLKPTNKKTSNQADGAINLRHTEVCRQVFDLLYPRLLFFAARIIEDHTAAKDITQEAFLYIMEKPLVFNDINAVKSYLYACVKNKCLNYLRDFREKITLVEIESMASQEESIDKTIIEQELKGRMINAIESLSETERKIILLRLEEKSYDEISHILSLSINTVKTHKKAAYRKMRIRLGERPDYF